MRRDIQSYVAHCAICQQSKYSTQKSQRLLQPLSIPVGVWEDISMDFITGFPSSNGFSVVLLVVDRLSKFAHFMNIRFMTFDCFLQDAETWNSTFLISDSGGMWQ